MLFVRNLNYSTRKANTHATQNVESEKLFVKWNVIQLAMGAVIDYSILYGDGAMAQLHVRSRAQSLYGVLQDNV